MDFNHIANQYSTPLYVYDMDRIKQNFHSFKDAFSARKSLICYALKANSNLHIIKTLASLGAGADCVSIGEVKKALICGIPKYKIIYSGVGKRDDEITQALQSDILFINVESKEELFRIEKIASELGIESRISIRVNPNIDPKTHPYISTGLYESKFGVDVDCAREMYIHAKKSKSLNPVGIHFHIGSQLCDLEPIRQSAQKIAQIARELVALNIELKFFDVGGGLGIKYTDENTIPLYDYAQCILDSLRGLDLTIICEPGRRIVGDGGFFVTKVLYEKHNTNKRFVIVDGANNDFMRPSLYNAIHKSFVLEDRGNQSVCDIVGPVCESSDYLAKNTLLPQTKHNDLVIFENAGAYGYSMSSNYNSREKVAEVAVYDASTKNPKTKLIRKRQNIDQMIEEEMLDA